MEIAPHSKVSIAAACFSIYAYEELKDQLEKVDALRFIFTSPSFLSEPTAKEKREFYIPARHGKKHCMAASLRSACATSLLRKPSPKNVLIGYAAKCSSSPTAPMRQCRASLLWDSEHPVAYAPINGFTRADLGCERGGNMFSMIQQLDAPESKAYLQLFDQLWADKRRMQDVTEQVLDRITTAYQENSRSFSTFLRSTTSLMIFWRMSARTTCQMKQNGFKDSLVWNKLYTFQKDAVLAIISKLEQYNGCILADSVGLGKTFKHAI